MPKEEYGPVRACRLIPGMFTKHLLCIFRVPQDAEDIVLAFTLFTV